MPWQRRLRWDHTHALSQILWLLPTWVARTTTSISHGYCECSVTWGQYAMRVSCYYHVILLLRSLLWLPIACRVKLRLLNPAFTALLITHLSHLSCFFLVFLYSAILCHLLAFTHALVSCH